MARKNRREVFDGEGELDLGSWFILRMATADTLKVHASLKTRGFLVWTPVERRNSRRPRSRARTEREFPLLPSYVFGHVSQLEDMLKASMVPQRDMPRFTVFHHNGGIPLIADNDLSPLREEEDRHARILERLRRKIVRGPTFAPGTAVATSDGGFAGLSGEVVETQGKFTLVAFPGFPTPIKIASLLLAENVQAVAESHVGLAA